jgi:hypothetical protein
MLTVKINTGKSVRTFQNVLTFIETKAFMQVIWDDGPNTHHSLVPINDIAGVEIIDDNEDMQGEELGSTGKVVFQ